MTSLFPEKPAYWMEAPELPESTFNRFRSWGFIPPNVSRGQLTSDLLDQGPKMFPTSLALHENADNAFTTSYGFVPDRDSKVRIYAAMLNQSEDFVDDNFDMVEKSWIFGGARNLQRAQSEWGALVERQMRKPQTQEEMMFSYRAALAMPADQEARMQKLAQLLGLPVGEVRANPELAESVWLMAKAKQDLRDADEATAWLSDPRNMTVMKEELPQAAALNSFLVSKHGSFGDYVGTQTIAMARHFGGAFLGLGLAGREITNRISKVLAVGPVFNEEGVRAYAEGLRHLAEQTVALTDEASPVPRLLADVTTGIVQMGGWMALSAVSSPLTIVTMGVMEGGSIYPRAREAEAPILQASLAMAGAGALGAWIEQFQLKGVRRIVGLKGLPSMRLDMVGRLALDVVSNAGQEWAQGISGQAASYFGELGAPGRMDERTFWDQISETATGDAAYEGLVGGLTALAFVGLRAPGINHLARRIALSQEMHQRLAAASQVWEKSKAAKAAPESVVGLVDTLTKGQPTGTVSISAERVQEFFATQSRKVKAELLDALKIDPAEFEQALVDKREVEFQLSSWMASVAQTEMGLKLVGALRVGDLQTIEEIAGEKAHMETMVGDMAQAVLDLSGMKEPIPETLKVARKKLREAGFSRQDTDALIALTLQRFVHVAQQRGETTAQVAERVGLEIVVDQNNVEFVTEEQAGGVQEYHATQAEGAGQEGEVRLGGRGWSRDRVSKGLKDEIVFVNLREFMDAYKKAHPEHYVGPGGEGGIAGRYESVQKIVGEAAVIDMPQVVFDKTMKQFGVTDGRHRLAALLDAGVEVIPVALRKGGQTLPGELSRGLGGQVKGKEYYAEAGDEILAKVMLGQGKAIITLLKGSRGKPDVVLDELGHIFIRMHQDLAKDSPAGSKVVQDLANLEARFGDLNVPENSQRCVEAFLHFLKGAQAPTPELAGAFRRFTNWMNRIWGHLRNLFGDVVDPELKDIFEHWFATDAQIEQAEAYYRMGESVGLLIKDLQAPSKPRRGAKEEPQGPSKGEQQFADAQAAQADVAAEAREKAAHTALNRWLKEIGGRQALRDRVAAEVRATPIYAALRRILEAGGISPELLDSLQNQHAPKLAPGTWAQLLQKLHGKRVVSAKGITDQAKIEAIADGFRNARELLETLADTRPESDAVKAGVNEQIEAALEEARKAQELTDGVALSGQEVTHTDKTLDMLLADLAILAEQFEGKQKRAISRAEALAIKDRLAQWLDSLPVEQARRYKSWAALEAQHVRAAFQAAQKGDLEAAWDARRKQLNYHLLMMAAIENFHWVEKFQKRYSAGKGGLNLNNLPEWYAKTIQDVLATWGIRLTRTQVGVNPDGSPVYQQRPIERPAEAVDGKLLMPEDVLVGEADAEMRDLIQPLEDLAAPWILDKEHATDRFETLPRELLAQLDDFLQAVVQEARGLLADLKTKDVRTIEEFAAKAIEPMRDRKTRRTLDQSKAWQAWQKKWGRGGEGWAAKMEFLMEYLDGNPLLQQGSMGMLHQAFRRGSDLQNLVDVRIRQLLDGSGGKPALEASFKTFRKQIEKWRAKFGQDYVPSEIYKVPDKVRNSERGWQNLSFDALIAFGLNLGRDVGTHALMASEWGMTSEQIETLKGLFDSETVQALQNTWNTVGSLYTEIAVGQMKTRHQRVKKEAGTPLSWLTADGKMMQLEGGYYPMIFDPEISMTQAARNERQDALDRAVHGEIHRSHRPRDGFTKDVLRKKDGSPVSKQPPLLSVSVLESHLKQALHLAHMGPWLKDMQALGKNTAFRDEFIRIAGHDLFSAYKSWINHIARPSSKARDVGTRALNSMSAKFTTAILGYKMFVGFKQILSLPGGINQLTEMGGNGFSWYMKGLSHFLSMKDPMGFIHGLSVMMKNRTNTMDRDLYQSAMNLRQKELGVKVNGKVLGWGVLKRFAFYWIQTMDAIAVRPLWMGAYLQKMDALAKDGVVMEDAQKIAAQHADALITTSQPAGLPIDLSEYQRKEGLMRVITLFTTWQQTAFNMDFWRAKAVKEGRMTKAAFAKHMLVARIMPAMAWMLVHSLLIRPDEDKYDWAALAFAPVKDVIGSVPFVSQAADAANLFGFGYGVQLPAFEGVERAGMAGKALTEGEVGRATIQMIRAIEFFAGAPVSNFPLDIIRLYYTHSGEELPSALKVR